MLVIIIPGQTGYAHWPGGVVAFWARISKNTFKLRPWLLLAYHINVCDISCMLRDTEPHIVGAHRVECRAKGLGTSLER